MANRFLNNITINDQYTFPSSDGTNGQILSTTGAADGTTELQFIDQGNIVAGEADKANSVILRVKNSTASAMSKGQVVCEAVSATPPNGNLIEVALADNNGTNTMPALGILNEDLDAAGGANDEGNAIMFGKVSGIDTSAFSVGDEVFVDDTPGGLTTTKPTGVKYIQKVGVVIRDDASSGTIEVFGAGRTNDVPNPLYIDHANQRLGIGTTSPTHKLQVVGNGAFNSTLSVQDPAVSSNGLLQLSHASTGSSIYSNPGSSNGSTVVLKLGINYSEKMRIANNGNVGIGTTNPGQKLHVDGNIRVGDSADTVYSNRFYGLSNAHVYLLANSGYDLKFYAGATEKMTVKSSGNVGIGITSPAVKLHVGSTSTSGSTTEEFRIQTGTGGGYGGDAIANLVTGSFGTSGIYFGNSSTYTSQDAYLKYQDSNNATTLHFSSSLNLEQGTSGSRMYINPSGNVGIGTTNPTEELHIAATNAPTIKFSSTSPGSYPTYGKIDSGAGFLTWANVTLSGGIIGSRWQFTGPLLSGRGDTYINLHDTNGIDVIVNDSQVVKIEDGGNVGIGTTSPSQKLSVAPDTDVSAEIGKAHIGQVGFNDYAGFSHVDQNTQQGYALIQQADGSTYMNANTGKNIRFRIANSDKMILNSSGNVGIGTTSPSEKLNISGGNLLIAGDFQSLYVGGKTDSSQDGLRMSIDNAGNGYFDHRGAGNLNFRVDSSTGASTRMVINSNGNVGIGTTSPSQKLHVNGSALVTDNLYIYSTSYYLDVFFGRIDVQAANGLNVRSGTTYKPVYASAFTVSSDYRLKSNIVPLENAISRVNQLEVHRFNWNDRLNEPKVDGFIAHEVASIIPEAVLGEKDAVHEDGTPNHQGIDQAKIVPLLTAALQEAISKIENLEARIQTLENQ